MRTLSLLAILLTLILGTPISSISSEKPSEDQKSVTSISDALKSPDGTPVILIGNVFRGKAWGFTNYFLHNKTGDKIAVDIDDKIYQIVIITPQATVRIWGKVNRRIGREPIIDVKRLKIL